MGLHAEVYVDCDDTLGDMAARKQRTGGPQNKSFAAAAEVPRTKPRKGRRGTLWQVASEKPRARGTPFITFLRKAFSKNHHYLQPHCRIRVDDLDLLQVLRDVPLPGAVAATQRLCRTHSVVVLTARGQYEDPFETTRKWLDRHEFCYHELIVVRWSTDKYAHLYPGDTLIDDFDMGKTLQPALEAGKSRDAKIIHFNSETTWSSVVSRLLKDPRS